MGILNSRDRSRLNNTRDAFINAKTIDVTFYKPLVNVALKFYVVNLTSCNFNF